jgi:flagellar motility protein MotE (MotC chaperone)
MDDTTAVKILSLMKPDTVGPIFEEMAKSDSPVIDAYRAARLSERLRLVKDQKASPTQ